MGNLSTLPWVDNVDVARLEPHLSLLLVDRVLDPEAGHVLLPELANEVGIPELGADAQVLAAAHEGVGLAAFDGGGELFIAEEGVLAL